jgi:hypothetical protein
MLSFCKKCIIVGNLLLLLCGCESHPLGRLFLETQVPTAPNPPQTYAIFNADYDSTWNCTLLTISQQRGVLILQDKTLGTITYYTSIDQSDVRVSGEIFYVTLYIKENFSNETSIYYTNWYYGSPHPKFSLEVGLFLGISSNITRMGRC